MATSAVDGVAVITGAAGGIGRQTAFSFAEAGAAAIVFADIDEVKAQQTAEESKQFASNPEYRVLALYVDVTDAASVQRMIDTAIEKFGTVDYSVNSAGVSEAHQTGLMLKLTRIHGQVAEEAYVPISECSIEDFENVMNVNVKGVLICVRAMSKAMAAQEPRTVKSRNGTRDIGRGSIVNVASANSYAGQPGKTAYVTSKHAVSGITKNAAIDNATHRVRVNAVCPSWVRTPMLEEEIRLNPSVPDAIKAACPFGRIAEPEEVADVIVFLCSPGASYVTGTGLIVDAGLTLTLHVG